LKPHTTTPVGAGTYSHLTSLTREEICERGKGLEGFTGRIL
jgi:hypothetical protein